MSVGQTNYSKIIQQFRNCNYNEESTLHERQLKTTLDTIVSRNTSMLEFNPEVAGELYDQCDKEIDGAIKVRTFANIVVRAQSILKQNISKAESQLAAGGLDGERKRDLQESLAQYHDDLRLLSLPFTISLPAESRMSQKLNASVSRNSYNQSVVGASGGMQQSGFFSNRSSGIFADVPSKRENSGSLKFTLIVMVVLFLIELLITFNKTSFFNLLVYCSIFSIIFLGYFDRYYMKFVLFCIVLSIVLDLLWVIFLANAFWNPPAQTTRSTLQTGFLRFQFAMVIVLMICKVILFLMLFRYRNNGDNVRKVVTVMGNAFQIDGRGKENNPIYLLLSGKGIFGSQVQ